MVYDGVNLSVFAAPIGMSFGYSLSTFAIDIPSIIGGQEAFVGFIGGTAAEWGDHDLVEFSYDSTIPSPGTLALFAGALLSFGRRRR